MAEIEQDFDRLTETSMLFASSDWQAQDGRFEGKADYTHKCIYWFERYADLVLAKALIKSMQEEFAVMYDSVLDQWVMTSTYATETWR
jgi:hypothetical protein